jgi:DNA-binding NtrC family response regulator
MPKGSVLVVDDDESAREYVTALVEALGYDVSAAASAEAAMPELGRSPPEVVLLDLVLPRMSGLELLDWIRRNAPGVGVVVLSTVGEIKTVVEAMSRGASNYLTKPFREAELELAIRGATEKERLREEVRVLRHRLDHGEATDMVSSDERMLRVRDIASQVADSDAPVLILGETGVGKEVVARLIHGLSDRRDRALVKVNCAALPHDLLESELFGYEKGAFSGAVRDKPGKFELANRGSILLDEIGEMSPHLQAKLLHVLQDGEFSRLGASRPTRTDARVLATTNRPLEQAVASGLFREDLYFRLNVVRLEVPPLRERRADIPLLVRAFEARHQRPGTPRTLPPELTSAFLAHDWPGNVRELENAVRRYMILPDLGAALEELGRSPRTEAAAARGAAPGVELSLKALAAKVAEEAERKTIQRVLAETRWNRRQAARQLKISYKTLLNKLKRWRVEESGPVPPADGPETRAKRPV